MYDDAHFLKHGEKIDDLQRSGLRIIQDPGRFCFGMDAVLLTGFAQDGIGGRSMASEDLLDLGTGTGIIPLLMSAKTDCMAERTAQPVGAAGPDRAGRYQGGRRAFRACFFWRGDVQPAIHDSEPRPAESQEP